MRGQGAFAISGKVSSNDSGRIIKATAVAIVILLASHGAYQWAVARYAHLDTSTPLPEGTLNRLSMKIGDWAGQDVPLDQDIVRFTDTDDRVNRTYRRGLSAVNLYVAYGVRLRDLAPHRPETCYTGAGWLLDTASKITLQLPSGESLPVQVQSFTKGEFDKQYVTVLNYYLINGFYSSDVSTLRKEGSKLSAHKSYSAQVQVVASGSPDTAAQMVKMFAEESAGPIRDLIVNAVHDVENRRIGSRPAATITTRTGPQAE